MNNFDHDEKIIEDLIRNDGYFIVHDQKLDDEKLLTFLTEEIKVLPTDQTTIITITGGPGSGKTTLKNNLLDKLKEQRYFADSVSGEDFNILDRENRDAQIAAGADPLLYKDFNSLKYAIRTIKEKKTIIVPVYDRQTGSALIDREKNLFHEIADNLHFFFLDSDFQPLENPDYRIYLYVPTAIRRENRIRRDAKKQKNANEQSIRNEFDFRLASQYYPYTIPHAEKADLLILAQPAPAPHGYKYSYKSLYTVYKRKR